MTQRFLILPIIVLLTCLIGSSIGAAQTSSEKPSLEQAKKLLIKGTRFYSETDLLAAETMFAALDPQDKDAKTKFWLAYTQHFLRDYYRGKENKEKAAAYNELALKNAEMSARLDPKAADTQALLGNLYSMKITFSNSPYAGMEFGTKAILAADKSLELDPKSPLVNYYMGVQKMYTPEIYGGDMRKAVDYFTLAVRYQPDFYDAYMLLAQALLRLKEGEKARDVLIQAVKCDPEREPAKDLLKRLEERLAQKKSQSQ